MQLARLGRPVLQRHDVTAGLPRENRRRRIDVVGIEIIALCSVTLSLLHTAGPSGGLHLLRAVLAGRPERVVQNSDVLGVELARLLQAVV